MASDIASYTSRAHPACCACREWDSNSLICSHAVCSRAFQRRKFIVSLYVHLCSSRNVTIRTHREKRSYKRYSEL